MPDYNCTPPKGGGKGVRLFLLAVLVVICAAIGREVAHYFIYVLIGIGVIAAASLTGYIVKIRRNLQARTWQIEDASVMSKHDALQWQYAQRHPLDGGPVIQGEVIPGEKPAITEGNRRGTSGLPPWGESERSGSPRSEETRDSESRWPKKRP